MGGVQGKEGEERGGKGSWVGETKVKKGKGENGVEETPVCLFKFSL